MQLRDLLGKRRLLLNLSLVLFLAFGSLLFTPTPAHAEEQWWAQENWENDTISITAPEGWEFYNITAWYGSPNDPNCGADVSELLTNDAKGKTEYTIYANNNTFGDPCGGVYKVFRFTWSIIPLQIVVPPVEPPVIVDPPVEPPIEPPVIVDPPVEPPVVDPPVDPVIPDPPVEPVVPEPPVEPEIIEPPVTPEEPVVPPIVPTEPIEIPSEPVVEEPKEEPSPSQSLNSLVNISPSEMTSAQVEQLQEAAYAVLESTEQGTPEYEQALDALFVAAQADDMEVSEELAAVPVLGAVAVGITDAINFIGNVGSDMSPAVREKSEKIVVSAVVVGQIAATAGVAAASVSAGGIRRKL